METQADSARLYLLQLDESEDLTEEQQARYALLWTQALHKCHQPLGESDSLIDVAVEYYRQSGEDHRLAKALLYKGLLHKQNHRVEQAAKAFAESEHAFEDVDDDQYKALLFNHYGSLLFEQHMFDEALEYHKKAYRYNLKGDSIHYTMSTCGQIATVYKLKEMPDSVEAYYERGLLYMDRCGTRKEGRRFMHNYSTFLIERGQYDKAEQLLKESERLADSTYIYKVYSALSLLYNETGRHALAREYGKRTLESPDSLIRCGGYFRLYKVYRSMGNMDSAFHYHNLFRQYDSDLILRRQTAQVAAIPHKVINRQLAEERHNLYGWRLWLVIGLGAVLLSASGLYVAIRRKHRREQLFQEQELDNVHRALAKTTVNLGQVKGAMTNQKHLISRLKENLEDAKEMHKEEIHRLKESIKKLEADIKELKRHNRERKRTESELKQKTKELDKQLREQTDELAEMERQRDIDLKIDYYVMNGRDSVAVDLLLQLRYGENVRSKYDIRTVEYLPLLKTLLESESPELHARLEQSGLEWKKLTMCYLMALGLDDVGMMSQAACLAPNSVKAYRKECRQVLEAIGQE